MGNVGFGRLRTVIGLGVCAIIWMSGGIAGVEEAAAGESSDGEEASEAKNEDGDSIEPFCNIEEDKIEEYKIDYTCKLTIEDPESSDGLTAAVYSGRKSCMVLDEGNNRRACLHSKVCATPYTSGPMLSQHQLKKECSELREEGESKRHLGALYNSKSSERYMGVSIECEGLEPQAYILEGKTPWTDGLKTKRCAVPDYLK